MVDTTESVAATAASDQVATPTGTSAAGGPEQVKEWYVLLGLSGKCLGSREVKELYDADKVKIRGPYAWDDILKFSNNGMIKASTIMHKKGEPDWVPFKQHNVPVPDEVVEEPVTEEQPKEQLKEWYVLSGMVGKILDAIYIEELYQADKVKIEGPYTKDELVKFYNGGIIANETILFKKGDKDWKPLASQKIQGIQEVMKSIIFDSGDDGTGSITKPSFFAKALGKLSQRKIPVLVTAILVLVLYVLGSNYYYTPKNFFNRVKKSLVLIASEDIDNNFTNLGLGFIIEDTGIIVTNLHIICKSANIKVKSVDNTTYDIEGIVHIDNRNDLALLKIKKGPYEIVKIATDESNSINLGERVYTIGSSVGMELFLSEGVFSGKSNENRIDKEPRERIHITAPIYPGHSGGPVLNKKGRVIGVTSRTDWPLNFAVPVALVGDTKNYKEVTYKFLPKDPEWKPIPAKLSAAPQNTDSSGSYTRSIQASYNEASIAKYSDKRRLWLKLLTSYHQNYNPYSDSLPPTVEKTSLALIELDCKRSKYRFNINLPTDDNGRALATSNFNDNNRWYSMESKDKPDFEELCR